jgi:hypothetical protein
MRIIPENEHMETPPDTTGPPVFRTAPAYRMPDRAKYEASTGMAPRQLTTDVKFVSRALGRVKADAETVNFAGSVNARATLDAICESVHQESGMDSTDTVFFDPETQSFWVFPGSRDTQIA